MNHPSEIILRAPYQHIKYANSLVEPDLRSKIQQSVVFHAGLLQPMDPNPPRYMISLPTSAKSELNSPSPAEAETLNIARQKTN